VTRGERAFAVNLLEDRWRVKVPKVIDLEAAHHRSVVTAHNKLLIAISSFIRYRLVLSFRDGVGSVIPN
jgi:hypothetical protein